jgi:mono/diheme cytochrome c family protein
MKTSGTTALVLAAGAAIVVVVGVGYMSVFYSKSSGNMDSDSAIMVAEGKVLYTENCAACHGANLKGQPNWQQRKADGTFPPPPQDETGHSWHHPDKVLFNIVKLGGKAVAPPGFKSAMPSFADKLSDKQIWETLSYIKSRWPKTIRIRQERINKRAG